MALFFTNPRGNRFSASCRLRVEDVRILTLWVASSFSFLPMSSKEMSFVPFSAELVGGSLCVNSVTKKMGKGTFLVCVSVSSLNHLRERPELFAGLVQWTGVLGRVVYLDM